MGCGMRSLRGWLPGLALALWSGLAVAQEPVEAGRPELDENKTAWDRMIYLPYKNIGAALTRPDSTVLIPLDEYLRLWEQANGAASEKTPVKAVIAQADYVATVEQKIARVNVTLTVQVLGEPWVELPIRFGDAAIGKVTAADNKPVLLRGTGEGSYSLLLGEKGEYKIQIELTTRVLASPDGQSIQLTGPPVGVTNFELVIPEADQTVEVLPNLIAQPVAGGEKETRIKANLGATQTITARWHPRASIKPDMDLLASVENLTLVIIQEGQIQTHSFLEYEVLRGDLNQVKIALPLGHRILDVNAPNAEVRGWKAAEEAEAKRQVIVIDLLDNVKKKLLLEIHTERPLPEGTFDVAGIQNQEFFGIHALEVVRESGQLVVSRADDLTLTVQQLQGLVRVDESEINQKIRGRNSLNFKFYSPSFILKLDAQPVQPQVSAVQNTQLVFRDDELRLTANLAYTVERIGVFELKLKVPQGLTIDAVQGPEVRDFNVVAATGELTVLLTARKMGAINVQVDAHQPLPEGNGESLALPILEPLNLDRETGFVAVFAPESLEIVTDEAKLRGLHPEPSAPMQQGNARLVSYWSYNRRPLSLAVATRRKPTRLSAKVGTQVQLKQDQVAVTTRVDFVVEHAGVDTFRIQVPEAVAKDVTIQREPEDAKPAIKQRTRAEQAENGWVAWTVVLQDRAIGLQRFRVTYDVTTADGNAGAEQDVGREVGIQPLQALGLRAEDNGGAAVALSSMQGELTVFKDQALSVKALAADDNLEAIDVRELKFLAATDAGNAAALAYRYFKQPVSLRLLSARHEIQNVVETVISRALAEIIVGKDVNVTYRCRYSLKSSERQRLRVDLPAGMKSLGVLVDRRPVALEKNEDDEPAEGCESYYVNVARSGGADDPFTLTLLFQAPLESAPFDNMGGRLLFHQPRIGGGEGNAAVQQLKTIVWVPLEFRLVTEPEGYVRERSPKFKHLAYGNLIREQETPDLESWINVPTGSMLDFPTAGHHAYRYSSLGAPASITVEWWRFRSFVWALSGALLLLGLLLTPLRWASKLSLILIGAFAVSLFALKSPEWVLHGLAAAQWGLLAALIFWVIQAIFGRRAQPVAAPVQPTAPPTAPSAGPGPYAAVIPPPGVFDMIRELTQKK